MKDISDSYLDRYRRKLADLNDIENETQLIRQKYDKELTDVAYRRTRVTNEINEMRQVITTMIDHGIDPVEAKLRNEQQRDTMWSVSMASNNWDLNGLTISTENDISMVDISSAIKIAYDELDDKTI